MCIRDRQQCLHLLGMIHTVSRSADRAYDRRAKPLTLQLLSFTHSFIHSLTVLVSHCYTVVISGRWLDDSSHSHVTCLNSQSELPCHCWSVSHALIIAVQSHVSYVSAIASELTSTSIYNQTCMMYVCWGEGRGADSEGGVGLCYVPSLHCEHHSFSWMHSFLRASCTSLSLVVLLQCVWLIMACDWWMMWF